MSGNKKTLPDLPDYIKHREFLLKKQPNWTKSASITDIVLMVRFTRELA